MNSIDWSSPESPLAEFVRAETARNIAAFRAQPRLLKEQSNIEQTVVEGGYNKKQINELIQNAADAMDGLEGRIEVVLTDTYLYCANAGAPFQRSGVASLLMSHSSEKTGNEIGRFGLGFKSVLAVTESPEVFSRSVSFRWDKEELRKRLEEDGVRADQVPALRAAVPVDPTDAADSDPVLGNLMEWASTVVRLPLLPHAGWLWSEMQAFPGEFLLFSDKIGTLVLSDRRSGEQIVWTANRNGENGIVSLARNGESADWQVFSLRHEPSESAKAEAGHLSARNDMTVTWAVPRKRRNRRGQLWTFFPTTSETSLTGIVNAPFKMNEDRHNVLAGLYNKEILTRTLPRAVAGALPSLLDPKDPGSVLDLLPARGKEAQSWADETLNQAIMEAVASSQSIPDMAGKAQLLDRLRVPDMAAHGDDQPLVEEWYSLAAAQGITNWIHLTCINHKDRNATLTRLLGIRNLGRKNVQVWLETLSDPDNFDALEAVLGLAVKIKKSYPEHLVAMHQSRIVLDASGELRQPIVTEMSLPLGTAAEEKGNKAVIHPAFVAHGRSRRLLMDLGFNNMDAAGQLKRQLLIAVRNSDNATAMESAWRISRNVRERGHVAALFTDVLPRSIIFVRCSDGQWRPIDHVWVRGGLFPNGHVHDADLLVDEQFHRHDMDVLRRLDIRQQLAAEARTRDAKDPTYAVWADSVAKELMSELKEEGVPVGRHHISFGQVSLTPGLERLRGASAPLRARVTETLLGRPHFRTSPNIAGNYVSNVDDVDQPDLWWIHQYGVLRTPYGLVPAKTCVGNVDGLPADVLPTPSDPRAHTLLRLPTTIDGIDWLQLFDLAARALSIDKLHELYALAAQHGVRAPADIAVEHEGQKMLVAIASCSVTSSRRTYDHLRQPPAVQKIVLVDSASKAAALSESWGLALRQISFTTAVDFSPAAASEALTEVLPYLPKIVKGTSRLQVQWCEKLAVVESNDFDDVQESTDLTELLEDKVLYIRRRRNIDNLLAALIKTNGLRVTVTEIKLKHAQIEQERNRTDKPLDELLADLLGRNALESLVTPSVLSMIESMREHPLTPGELFEVARSIHGVDLLKEIKKHFTGLATRESEMIPAGSTVWDFLTEIIGTGSAPKSPPPLPREEVLGPVVLNPLHDYQKDVSEKIRALLRGETSQRRGLLMLPTGAGKTRAMTESLVRHVAETPGNFVVVWLAQTTELCEQAIDSWKYVWQAIGAAGERMVVSRFWGGMADATEFEDVKFHLVVGTPHTTVRIADAASKTTNYAWLFGADILIFDEAHGTTAPSYTKILEAFGRSHRQRTKPLLGMSATPFKGTNEERTKQLVNRFGGYLIQPSQFTSETSHEYLQNLGVLSRVRHEMIDGMELRPTPMNTPIRNNDEPMAMKELQLDLKAVAANEGRNKALIEDIVERRAQSSSIVFAASVDHAQALAATLTYMGIKSASISGETSGAARRAAIEDFRRGKIRVLTNYNVLSEGFDAPGVDTVYVARPTFSPNRYLQMVGRGLRGPKNGGSAWTTIVNVQDNVEQFGTVLAFGHFDYLWDPDYADV
ncbi:DEAD/DEAH box helicase [Kocuria sp. CPCC 205263]|uniref:DEAD/DEAH box helicase n=1 Tax=Kocuria sp. CPCC 205263 TaxID=3073555 RepID=UPI0034D43770